MTRVKTACTALLALGFAVACTDGASREPVAPEEDALLSTSGSDRDSDNSSRRVAMRDDCDPRDPTWAAIGGCALKRGDVTRAEFFGELNSPLSASVVGHQAWRNDPSYIKIRAGKSLRVRNEGGRPHTFTKVANFGGGKVPPPAGLALNKGLVMAPECPASTDVPAGGRMEVSGLAVGNHRFMCCIHPWMRALVKVKPERGHGDR